MWISLYAVVQEFKKGNVSIRKKSDDKENVNQKIFEKFRFLEVNIFSITF